MPTTRRRQGQHPSLDERERQREVFLKEFRKTAIVGTSARKAGVSRATIYNWINSDPDFAEAFKDAEQDANDYLREEIRRRGVDGWLEPVYQKGQQVGTIRRYDARLLTLLAQARMPEFRNHMDVTSNGHTLGAHEATANAANAPTTTALASQFLNRIACLAVVQAGLPYIASNQRWRFARHLELLNDRLLDVAAGHIKRLMVFMPLR